MFKIIFIVFILITSIMGHKNDEPGKKATSENISVIKTERKYVDEKISDGYRIKSVKKDSVKIDYYSGGFITFKNYPASYHNYSR